MNQFNPYSQPMMNNPYQNGYNPMMNAQQRLQQMEMQYPQFSQQNMVGTQMSVPNQPQGIVGKIVNDFSELTANDVPMNGSAAFFPKADGSEIQARAWTANGTIQTVVYRPVQAENTAECNIPQMDFNALNEDVRALREDIMARLDAIEKSVSKPNTRSKKTEVSADE